MAAAGWESRPFLKEWVSYQLFVIGYRWELHQATYNTERSDTTILGILEHFRHFRHFLFRIDWYFALYTDSQLGGEFCSEN